MIKTEILAENGYKFDRKTVSLAISRTVAGAGVTGRAEVCILVVGEQRMKDLHRQYMKTAEVTDVLSFPLEEAGQEKGFAAPDGIRRLGDIVICYPEAVRQAAVNNRSTDEELVFLATHGCLHLLGIHHE